MDRGEIVDNPDKFLAQMSQKQKKLDRLRSREKELPAYLYHATKKENLPQILQEGIDPSELMSGDEAVSMSDDVKFALEVATLTQKTNRQNLVVLKIDTAHLTPSRIRNYLREPDRDEQNALDASEIHEVHYELNIPPEAISVIRTDHQETKK